MVMRVLAPFARLTAAYSVGFEWLAEITVSFQEDARLIRRLAGWGLLGLWFFAVIVAFLGYGVVALLLPIWLPVVGTLALLDALARRATRRSTG